MPYSKEGAAVALHAVETAERRLSILKGYERGAPYFFLWGVIWIVGYIGSELYPQHAAAQWLGLNLIGILAGLWIGKARPAAGQGAQMIFQYFGVALAAAAFVAATYFVLQPVRSRQFDAFPALLVGFIYMLAGLRYGIRYTVAGGVVTALTLAGYAFVPSHFALWMAGTGGGALLMTGVWLRRG